VVVGDRGRTGMTSLPMPSPGIRPIRRDLLAMAMVVEKIILLRI